MNALLKVLPDPAIQKSLLDLVLQGVEAGQAGELVAAGFDPVVLDGLRHLRSYELARLTQRDLGLTLMIDSKILGHQIGILKQQLNTQALQESFAQRGCPTALFVRLFRMHKRDVAALRLSIGMRSEPLQTLASAERARVETTWAAVRPTLHGWAWNVSPSGEHLKHEIQAWQHLMEAFPEVNLFTLYNSVCSFERLGHHMHRQGEKQA
jgi:hypothetical protein